MDSILLNVYTNGRYYNPAWSHYGRHTNVICDRCKTTQLKVCIGWEKYDLCMKCADQLSKHTEIYTEDDYDNKDITFMAQNMFRDNNRVHTYMAQNMYGDRNQPLTRMSQGMFHIGNNLINDENEDNNYNTHKFRTNVMQKMLKNKTEK